VAGGFSGGAAELLADADRPGGWLLLLDRIRQSYVDLDDPTYLDFEYMQVFADVLDAFAPGPLAVTHIGGGGLTLARYVAVTRPGSPQLVLEPDVALADLVRARLPLPRGARVRVRAVPGREGVAALRAASADVVVVDAFLGGRVPADLTTVEFVSEAARVLRPGGALVMNIADGASVLFARRVAGTLQAAAGRVIVVGDPAVLKGRRFGNLVLVASADALPVAAIRASAARAALPRTVVAGAALTRWLGGVRPLTDGDAMRSPQPPDEMWRVSG